MKLALLLLVHVSACFCAIDFSDRPRNFSIELVHHTQLQKEGHVVISPFGIWTLMSAVALGATGNSYNQLARTFILPKDKRTLVSGYKELTSVVLNPSTTGVTLTSKNFVFLDSNFKVYPEFERSMRQDFNSTVTVLNFQDPNSANIANNEIERTGANVKNVLHSEDFEESRMILTNVISFKGLWSSPFNASDTKEEVFYDEGKNVIGRVNMMSQKSMFAFSNIRSMEAFALEIPYGNDKKYSMLFILPYPNVKVTDAYKNLAKTSLKDIFGQLEQDVEEFGEEEIDVKIPRFKISTNLVMNKPLNDMGVFDIFQPNLANFGRVSAEDIFVSAIVHKADIEVTESGTVASAVTEAFFADRISSPTFHANKPFIYFLMEKTTMTMIFGGIYSKPTVF
ncbi:serine protease inhibitor 77Ba-like [Ostrinia furnacalis]|uniref:serine protease inhibitor 77Ba-like n=1 Tax=Ostrinia furnacalis TaxID=93504 RepID=UPI00103F9C4B|nr:serine protease inhibitor 77Ba-like [Ostrinia furnacalis]XP_028164032.1 serine protease inhibitor 77Ba-like [Ostrinia furnacalis]